MDYIKLLTWLLNWIWQLIWIWTILVKLLLRKYFQKVLMWMLISSDLFSIMRLSMLRSLNMPHSSITISIEFLCRSSWNCQRRSIVLSIPFILGTLNLLTLIIQLFPCILLSKSVFPVQTRQLLLFLRTLSWFEDLPAFSMVQVTTQR